MFWRKKTTSSWYRCLQHLLCISRLCQPSHYSTKQRACVFFSFSLSLSLFSVKWCLFFIKAIDLLQCLNDPGPHTPTSQTVQTQKIKCTDNQKEWTNGAAAGAQGLGCLLGMSDHAEPQTFRHDMTLAMFACTSAARSLVEVSTVFNCLQEPVTEPAWCYWFTSRPVL